MQRQRLWTNDVVSGTTGYVLVLALILLYLFLALRPFRWDNPRKASNGAVHCDEEIRFESPGLASSTGPAKWLDDAIRRNQFKLRLRVSSTSSDQQGPARIFTVSLDPKRRNLTIAQEGTSLSLRLRTPKTDFNGTPGYNIPDIFLDSQWHDIEFTVCDQFLSMRIDGETVLSERLPTNPFNDWDPSYRVALGNELTGDRPWSGRIAQAELDIDGRSHDLLSDGSLQIPETYWAIPSWKTILLDPFLGQDWTSATDMVLNLLCFVPLGFFLGFVQPTRESFLLTIGFVALLSLTVEVMQIGFSERYPSLLDWLANTLGAAMGACGSRRFKAISLQK